MHIIFQPKKNMIESTGLWNPISRNDFMGNIAYKVAPRHKVDNLIWDLKRIIEEQQKEMRLLKCKTTICRENNEPTSFLPIKDEDGYYDIFLQIGDVIEVIFNSDDKEFPYYSGVPYVGIIKELNTRWYGSDILSYDIFVMNQTKLHYNKERLEEEISLEQEEIANGTAKVKILMRVATTCLDHNDIVKFQEKV
jgi:hypothetical protein